MKDIKGTNLSLMRLAKRFFLPWVILIAFTSGFNAQVTVTVSDDPICENSTATATATINPSSATGTVQFQDGATDIGGPITVSGGVASLVLSGLTPGTHTINAFYTGNNPDANGSVNITITAIPDATISYAGPFCTSNAAPQSVTLTGTTGGTFSSTPGLTIDGATGAITPSTSTAGTYTVTYNIPASGGCAAFSTTVDVTITTMPNATISYAGPFCTSNAAPQSVTLTGTTGGTFSSTPGLTIDGATGAITPSTSTAGTYTVTYNIPASGGCAAFSTTVDVTITAMPDATISYAGPFLYFKCYTANCNTDWNNWWNIFFNTRINNRWCYRCNHTFNKYRRNLYSNLQHSCFRRLCGIFNNC